MRNVDFEDRGRSQEMQAASRCWKNAIDKIHPKTSRRLPALLTP
jgi:hypothetical protein